MPPTLDQHVTDVAIRTKAIADTRTVLLAGLVGAIGTFRLQSRVYEIIARLWADELPAQPPFPVDDETLVITYMAAAEMACFLKLGWPMPRRILDLYVEFRAITNGYQLAGGKGKRGLLNALQLYSVPGISKDEKTDMRELVLRGGPWTNVEKTKVLNYCQSDVDVLEPLLQRMMPALDATRRRLGQAPLRGRYMAAVAHMEHVGVPIDTDTFDLIRRHWTILKLDLVGEVDPAFGVYDGATFKRDRFAQMLAGRGIRWPYSDTGTPKLDQDTFRDMCKLRPELEPLRELRHALSELRLEKLRVGADGRNRAPLFPFGTRPQRAEQCRVRLRPCGVAAESRQAEAGPGHRLHRLVRAGNRHRGGAVR